MLAKIANSQQLVGDGRSALGPRPGPATGGSWPGGSAQIFYFLYKMQNADCKMQNADCKMQTATRRPLTASLVT